MFGFGKRECTLCGARVPTRQSFRAPDRVNGFVCRACVEGWERAGRRCAECQTAVVGPQEVGAFFEQRGLGHADCGGVRLFAA
jgi:hypothetical protein